MTNPPHLGTITILFTDLVGSTVLLERLGDDKAEELRLTHFHLLREAVTQLGGQEVKNLGDGLMVVFSTAVGAVRCAIQMQEAVRRHNQADDITPIQVRVGLHTGEPIHDENDYFGTPVVIASRLCDHADGGQVIASELVHGLVGKRDEFRFRHLGELQLKGLAQPISANEVVWGATAEDVSHRPAFASEGAVAPPGTATDVDVAPPRKRRRAMAAIASIVGAAGILAAVFLVTLGSDGDDQSNVGNAPDASAATTAPRLAEELHYRQELVYPNAVLEFSGIEEREGTVRVTAQWLTADSPGAVLDFYEDAFASLGVVGKSARLSAPELETLYVTGNEEGAVVTVQIGAGPDQENRIIVGFALE